jgi:RNA polymerase sigma factor (sigma-70 family)
VRVVTIAVEKEQVELLSSSILVILASVDKETGDGPPEELLELEMPLDPLWRAGRLSIGYAEDRDRMLLELEELVRSRRKRPTKTTSQRPIAFDLGHGSRCSRLRHGSAAGAADRCQFCGEPMDREGHTRPAMNGHRSPRGVSGGDAERCCARDGELEPLGLLPRSSNYTFLCRVRDEGDELLAVYKPRSGEAPLWDFPEGTLCRREVAAFVLADALGWPRVPPTVLRDGPRGLGSVQRFLRFDPAEHYFTMLEDRPNDFRRVALFDVVANNADRKWTLPARRGRRGVRHRPWRLLLDRPEVARRSGTAEADPGPDGRLGPWPPRVGETLGAVPSCRPRADAACRDRRFAATVPEESGRLTRGRVSGSARGRVSRSAANTRWEGRMDLPPFQRLLEEHRVAVYRFLVAAVGSHDADDCFQETFLAALRAYPKLRDDSNLRGWLFTIATSKAMDHWRASKRRPLPVDSVPERPAPETGEGRPELWRAVGELPPMQRAAVIHRPRRSAVRGDASALGCSEEATRANTYEGRRKLRGDAGAFA